MLITNVTTINLNKKGKKNEKYINEIKSRFILRKINKFEDKARKNYPKLSMARKRLKKRTDHI